ncbi:SAF domain-containing protein [Clostridium sartagoforme AAU1]|uniref:SAF domain-containing protein n=1 Tax=Clostridium sartagoforme AAU1 TaxID=1202534 RepID=R9CDT2_9CLOT|nr:UxaA family hydrolase [Clostridium sartagoforme]EOR27524.1 SAF domain-containing protein [Clostridium sartagoforme AAU1]
MQKRALLMDEKDNVAVVLDHVNSGDIVSISLTGESYKEIIAVDDIDLYHKIAVKEIKKEEEIYKYSEIIGKATEDISLGKHVHINNIESVMVL